MAKRSSSDQSIRPKRMKLDNIIDNNGQPIPKPSQQIHENVSLPSPSLTYESSKVKHVEDVGILTLVGLWIKCGNLAISMNNNYDIGIKCYQSALTYDPESKCALNGLVDSLVRNDMKLNKSDGILRAIDVLNLTMNKYPEIRNDVSLWVKLSDFYLSINEIEKCHTVLTTALEFAKDDPSLWLILGKCFNRMNIPRDAVNALTNSLYLLPKELIDNNDIDIARSVHLELASVIFNDGDVESAKAELGIVTSLPKPSSENVLKQILELSEKLIIHFFKYGNILNAIWVCESLERIHESNPHMLLLHGYLLLVTDTPSYNILQARRSFITSIRNDPFYQKSNNLMEFFNTSDGDFLPWLLLSECYLSLNYTSIMLDCLQVSIIKCTSKLAIPIIREHCIKLQSLCKDNIETHEAITNILNSLTDDNSNEKSISLKDVFLMSYADRLEIFESNTPIERMKVSQVNTNSLEYPASDNIDDVSAVSSTKDQPQLPNGQSFQYPQAISNIHTQPQLQQHHAQTLLSQGNHNPAGGIPIGFNYPIHMPPPGFPISHIYAPQPLTHSTSNGDTKTLSRSSNTPKSEFEEESRFRQHQEEMRNRQEEELRYYYQRQSLHPHPGMMLPPIPGYPPGVYPHQVGLPPGPVPAHLVIQQAQVQAQLQAQAQVEAQQHQYQAAHLMGPMDPSTSNAMANPGYNYF